MSWRDDLRRVTMSDGRLLIGASFRGVPFFVESSDRDGGRRIVTHEFPGRDDPFVEDLGRRARSFSIQGYVLGASYVAQRDALLGVLEDQSGPGELVHPYHGVRRAICSGLKVRESVADGGMALFSIDFTETPVQEALPTASADLSGKLDTSADEAFAATQVEFEAGYSAEGMPGFALASAAAVLSDATEAMGAALAPIVDDTQELARLDVEVRRITSQASSLVRAPDAVLSTFRSVLLGLASTMTDSPFAVVNALIETYGFDEGAYPIEVTATREREVANKLVLVASLRRIVALEAARLASAVTYDSHEDAIATRDAIAALLEEQAEAAGDDAYPALVQLQADLANAVPGDALLASIVTVVRPVNVPSLFLSYQLYGSVAQEEDIIKRNRVRHPGFLAGELTVLSDV